MSDEVLAADDVVGSMRLHLQRCTCGEHGVVTIIGRGGYAVQIKVYTFNEAQELYDRLLDAGGEIQEQFQAELAEADYLVDDWHMGEPTNLAAFLLTLQTWGKYEWGDSVIH